MAIVIGDDLMKLLKKLPRKRMAQNRPAASKTPRRAKSPRKPTSVLMPNRPLKAEAGGGWGAKRARPQRTKYESQRHLGHLGG